MEKTLLNCTPATFLEDESNIKDLLNNDKNWSKIPLLNYSKLQDLKDLSLVRFRGMIQDMFDPEIYLESYEVNCNNDASKKRIQNGKYRDCLLFEPNESVNYDSTNNVHGERRTLFVISIPGVNNWTEEYERQHMILNLEQNPLNQSKEISAQKRQITNENSKDLNLAENQMNINKKLKKMELNENESNQTDSKNTLSSTYLLNSPIAERPSKACMVKIYTDFDSYSLNTMVDVVGFLSVDPALDGTNDDSSEFNDLNQEIEAANPPPSLIPRLHAIAIKILKHSNPLLDKTFNDTIENDLNAIVIFKELKILLKQLLFDDNLAAEYLICHLISNVYIRTDLETLGQFTLNLYNIPQEVLPEYTKKIYEFIELILPISHYLPMTLKNMNEIQFVPQKDYITNKLTSGLLQLAPTTHLVLDETQLESGKLEPNGVKAVKNLANIIQNQQMKYDFKFYEINFNTNIPILILSEGRSMLPSNIHIPIAADSECIELIDETLKAAKHYIQSKLNLIRKYLTKCKLNEFTIDSAYTKIIENDFVEMRKTNKKIGPDVLHTLLVLSRLLGISRGKLELDSESWELAKQMESDRKFRIENLQKKKQKN